MIDIGEGPTVILIPGIQGRWEWMREAVLAVGLKHRAISYSLCGESNTNLSIEPGLGFDNFTAQLDAIFERAQLKDVTLCGVSYGGLIAVRYAAKHPHRVRGLVLVSTPAPSWKPDERVKSYLRSPVLQSPLFAARSPSRLAPEIVAAFPNLGDRIAFAVKHTTRVVLAPFSPTRMAERMRLLRTVDLERDCQKIHSPTLIITGEPCLDRVVPVSSTQWYLKGIKHARSIIFERTGHIGIISQPNRFAKIIGSFVAEAQSL